MVDKQQWIRVLLNKGRDIRPEPVLTIDLTQAEVSPKSNN